MLKISDRKTCRMYDSVSNPFLYFNAFSLGIQGLLFPKKRQKRTQTVDESPYLE